MQEIFYTPYCYKVSFSYFLIYKVIYKITQCILTFNYWVIFVILDTNFLHLKIEKYYVRKDV